MYTICDGNSLTELSAGLRARFGSGKNIFMDQHSTRRFLYNDKEDSRSTYGHVNPLFEIYFNLLLSYKYLVSFAIADNYIEMV